MRIDFRDPDIPFSPTPSPTTSPDIFPQTFSPDISPSNIPIFHEKGVITPIKTYIYSCARISEHVQNILTNLLKVD